MRFVVGLIVIALLNLWRIAVAIYCLPLQWFRWVDNKVNKLVDGSIQSHEEHDE